MRRKSWVAGDAFGLVGLIVLIVLALPKAANAVHVSLKLEPGIAIPLSAPQSQIYNVGGGESLKALFRINRYLDVGPTGFFLFLPAEQKLAASGSVWGLGGGLRRQAHPPRFHHRSWPLTLARRRPFLHSNR